MKKGYIRCFFIVKTLPYFVKNFWLKFLKAFVGMLCWLLAFGILIKPIKYVKSRDTEQILGEKGSFEYFFQGKNFAIFC